MHGKNDDFAINVIQNQNTKEPKVTWESWSHMSLSIAQGTFFFVNNAMKHSPHMTLVNAGFLMTSILSISLGTKFLTFISKTPQLYCFDKRK